MPFSVSSGDVAPTSPTGSATSSSGSGSSSSSSDSLIIVMSESRGAGAGEGQQQQQRAGRARTNQTEKEEEPASKRMFTQAHFTTEEKNKPVVLPQPFSFSPQLAGDATGVLLPVSVPIPDLTSLWDRHSSAVSPPRTGPGGGGLKRLAFVQRATARPTHAHADEDAHTHTDAGDREEDAYSPTQDEWSLLTPSGKSTSIATRLKHWLLLLPLRHGWCKLFLSTLLAALFIFLAAHYLAHFEHTPISTIRTQTTQITHSTHDEYDRAMELDGHKRKAETRAAAAAAAAASASDTNKVNSVRLPPDVGSVTVALGDLQSSPSAISPVNSGRTPPNPRTRDENLSKTQPDHHKTHAETNIISTEDTPQTTRIRRGDIETDTPKPISAAAPIAVDAPVHKSSNRPTPAVISDIPLDPTASLPTSVLVDSPPPPPLTNSAAQSPPSSPSSSSSSLSQPLPAVATKPVSKLKGAINDKKSVIDTRTPAQLAALRSAAAEAAKPRVTSSSSWIPPASPVGDRRLFGSDVMFVFPTKDHRHEQLSHLLSTWGQLVSQTIVFSNKLDDKFGLSPVLLPPRPKPEWKPIDPRYHSWRVGHILTHLKEHTTAQFFIFVDDVTFPLLDQIAAKLLSYRSAHGGLYPTYAGGPLVTSNFFKSYWGEQQSKAYNLFKSTKLKSSVPWLFGVGRDFLDYVGEFTSLASCPVLIGDDLAIAGMVACAGGPLDAERWKFDFFQVDKEKPAITQTIEQWRKKDAYHGITAKEDIRAAYDNYYGKAGIKI